ncbi:MAG: DUF4271 domain-containing protein [Bacteroidetes bacterium]|nr:DUF4271 domain-containing protein [Bacteroidota bacterium]
MQVILQQKYLRMRKPVFYLWILLFALPVLAQAQKGDTLQRPSLSNNSKDSLLQMPILIGDSVQLDSIRNDSLKKVNTKNASLKHVRKQLTLNEIIKANQFLNAGGTPVNYIESQRKFISKDAVFYILATLMLFLGILKVAYPRYFGNLVRVFFNTSLRQGQLTDQLLQAKLPSLLFNIFFILVAGWYLYILLNFFGKTGINNLNLLAICIGGLLMIYLVKYCTLKFAGWLTGYREEAETYIFIVFLINKIIALCLVPVVIIMPFSAAPLVNVTVIISFVVIVFMFLMRFFRSYGLLQNRLKVSGLHFLLYIIGIELLPLLLIYRFALVIVSKNL